MPLENLANSPAIDWLLTSEVAELKKLNRSTMNTISFTKQRFLPGYELFMEIDPDGQAYVVALRDSHSATNLALASDQNVQIYRGNLHLTNLRRNDSVATAQELLYGPQLARHRRPSFLRALAGFIPVLSALAEETEVTVCEGGSCGSTGSCCVGGREASDLIRAGLSCEVLGCDCGTGNGICCRASEV